MLTGCLNSKGLPILRFNFMIQVSAKMLFQEVGENSLRSGRSQGKVKETKVKKSGHPDYGRDHDEVS